MECLGDLLDRKAALEPGWGGPGETKPLLDDGGEPGPGEERNEQQTDEWFVRRILMMEETMVRRGRDGQNQNRDGRGSGGQERDGRGSWGWERDGQNGWGRGETSARSYFYCVVSQLDLYQPFTLPLLAIKDNSEYVSLFSLTPFNFV